MPSEKIQRTLSWLDDHGISYEIHYHPTIFTIEDCLTHCKNLDIHALVHMLHQGKLSFASPGEVEWLEI